MKCAICYYGYMNFNLEGLKECYNTKKKPFMMAINDSFYVKYRNKPNDCFVCVKKHIIECNKQWDFDIFVHSWDYDLSNEIQKTYNPKLCFYENNDEYHRKLIETYKNKNINNELLERIKNKNNPEFTLISMNYSISKSNELRKKYESDNNINYDCVIIIRPDFFFIKDIILDRIDLKCMNIGKEKNQNLDIGDSIDDHFFISRPSGIDILASYVNNITNKSKFKFRKHLKDNDRKNADILSFHKHTYVAQKIKFKNVDLENIKHYNIFKKIYQFFDKKTITPNKLIEMYNVKSKDFTK